MDSRLNRLEQQINKNKVREEGIPQKEIDDFFNYIYGKDSKESTTKPSK